MKILTVGGKLDHAERHAEIETDRQTWRSY